MLKSKRWSPAVRAELNEELRSAAARPHRYPTRRVATQHEVAAAQRQGLQCGVRSSGSCPCRQNLKSLQAQLLLRRYGLTVCGEPAAMGYCHCESCRSWSAGPVDAVGTSGTN